MADATGLTKEQQRQMRDDLFKLTGHRPEITKIRIYDSPSPLLTLTPVDKRYHARLKKYTTRKRTKSFGERLRGWFTCSI
jgi:hypothetical protein